MATLAEILARLTHQPPSPEALAADVARRMPMDRRPATIRAATTTERLQETLRAILSALAAQPVGQVTDALGLTGFDALANQPPPEVMLGQMPDRPSVRLGDVIKGLAAKRVPHPIIAYHGSPHDFDQFRMDKIGTGEGAQAYGHGLYFAEAEPTALSYKSSTARPAAIVGGKRYMMDMQGVYRDDAGRTLSSRGDTAAAYDAAMALKGSKLDKPAQVLAEEAESYLQTRAWATPKSIAAAKEAILSGYVKADPQGHMYEVAIHADPESFLDWDKPLSRQSEKVRRGIAAQYPMADAMDWETDKFYRAAPPDQRAAELQQAGIAGIKYLDQGSRGPAVTYDVGAPAPDFGPYSHYRNKADADAQLDLLRRSGFANAEIKETHHPQTSNYVVFDDALIEILRKYGLLPFAAGLGAARGED